MQYFYEGKTIRGLGWVQWSLYVFLGLLVATLLLSVAIAGLVGTAYTLDPVTLLPSLLGVLAAACGLVILEIVGLVLYCVGFGYMYGGRREFGVRHARHMDWSLVFFIVTAVLFAAQSALPSTSASFVTGAPALVNPSMIGLILAASAVLRALDTGFAGLTLLFGAYAFADAGGARRLVVALILGVAGSVVGSVVTIVGLYTLPASEYGTMIIAGALGGTGVGAISLLLYLLAYREILGRLRSGAIPAALPLRPPMPWPYYAPYPYPWAPPPTAPVSPPPPPSPPPTQP